MSGRLARGAGIGPPSFVATFGSFGAPMGTRYEIEVGFTEGSVPDAIIKDGGTITLV